jgi:hypothetical protein
MEYQEDTWTSSSPITKSEVKDLPPLLDPLNMGGVRAELEGQQPNSYDPVYAATHRQNSAS